MDEGPLPELAREVVDGIVSRIVIEVYPPKIVDYDPSTSEAMLNYGDGIFEVGDTLEVYAQGKKILDPDTGIVLGYRESKLGRLEITSVRPKLS